MLKLTDEQALDLSNLQLYMGDLFSDEGLYKKTQIDTIKKAFFNQVETNPDYRSYCEALGFSASLEKNFEISNIPLIPSSMFKRKDIKLNSVSDDQIIKYCSSSGTQGGISIVPRDEETLINFFGSITSTLSCLFGLEKTGNHKAFILGPDPEESGDLWFSYVLSSMALNFNTEYFVRKNSFDIADAALKIMDATQKNCEVMIVSPPFRVVELCQYMSQMKCSVPLKGNSFVISAGGWKDKRDQAIPKSEYRELVANTFQIKTAALRDSFNMVELNTVLNECEFHEKHVLPWVEVLARDPKSNEVLGDDTLGILSFYDGSSTCFPCFILSEDYGTTSTEPCACGRVGKRIKIFRRMNRIESRGCALKMADNHGSAASDHSATRFYSSFFRNPNHYRQFK